MFTHVQRLTRRIVTTTRDMGIQRGFATHLPDELIAGSEETAPVQPVRREMYHHSKREQSKLIKQMPQRAREATAADQDRIMAEVFDSNAVGDKVIAMHKRMRTTARETYLFDGHASHNDLDRSTRASPIWWTPKKIEERFPRTPMPSDLATSTSPTVGLLYAYRLHHARMYLEGVRRKQQADQIIGYADLNEVKLDMPHVEGADNQAMVEIAETYKQLFRRFPGISLKEKSLLLADLRDLLPKVIRVQKEEIIKKKKRKK